MIQDDECDYQIVQSDGGEMVWNVEWTFFMFQDHRCCCNMKE